AHVRVVLADRRAAADDLRVARLIVAVDDVQLCVLRVEAQQRRRVALLDAAAQRLGVEGLAGAGHLAGAHRGGLPLLVCCGPWRQRFAATVKRPSMPWSAPRGDCPRRAREPRMTITMLEIRVIGELRVRIAGEKAELPASRRARSLLGWLAVHP